MSYQKWQFFCFVLVQKDKKNSYFVGDAAGRADDFASTDRKFALNAGIQFYTPEVSKGPSFVWDGK